MRCNFILSLLLLLAFQVNAQRYYFENYTVKDGLSQSTVYVVEQDKNGYVWIGNKSGISRFDGVHFENFSLADGAAANGVRSLRIDSSGVIWFGHTGGGITRFTNDKFSIFEIEDAEITSDVTAIVEDEEGRIWLSTAENGVYRVNNPGSFKDSVPDVQHFFVKDGLSDRVFDMFMTSDGMLYFITDVGIKRYVKKKDSFESYAPENLSTFFQITTIFVDSRGDTWYGTYNGGLYHQKKESRQIQIYDVRDGLAYNWISCLAEDAQGRIWAGTWGGGITVIEDGELQTFNTKNGLPDLKIFDLSLDREGNMLIGTNESGLYLFKGEHFVAFTEDLGLSNDQVWAVLEDRKGRFWVGTNSGITIITKGKEGYSYSYINEEKNNFISNNIRFLKEDRNGDIWVGTTNGVIKINPDRPNGPYEYSGRLNSSIHFQLVTSMDVDKFNNLWVGTLEGLIYYEIDRKAMSVLTKSSGLAGNDISEIYCDSRGDVWVGCKAKGLTFIHDTSLTNIDLGGEITPNSIREDASGNIWIGTDGQGLFITKDKKNITEHFTVADGLLANLINLVEVDKSDNIWIGTNKGLNKFDRSNNTFVAYTEQDGFTGIETKSNASFRDRKGRLYFGTVKGLIRYDDDKDYSQSRLPLIKITGLRVNLDDRKLIDGHEFNYKEKSFYFNYQGIYLKNPKSVRYKVMLEGVDQDWSESTELNFANYPALPHGEYTFKVIASNNTGGWTEEPATYSFTITPPFWKTWWFYLFCVIFVGSWIIYLIKLREESLQREKKLLEEKVAERTAEVVEKNKELASKNKDITDSIRYAERIQRAILPPDEMVRTSLPDSFVFYRPKDIVSGDFYWVAKPEDKVMFAAVDCTGHGVPGAFMSIVGHNLMDKIVKEEKISTPALILDQLNNSVSRTLRQKSETDNVKDGMDLALVALNPNKREIEYAGAHNPLYIIRKGELLETKADKFAIGSFIRGEKKKFTNHVIPVEKGDVIYVFSDGFPDQFGGEAGKKYKYKPFKNFIISIHDKPMEEQMKLFEEEFIRWLGNYEQIDDVIIFGVRV